jgi:oligopeptide transport system substrate-binding protein
MRYRNPLSLILFFFLLTACDLLSAPAAITPTTLNYALPTDPITLDPARATDRASLDVTGLLYEGLTRYDPQTATVMPALAEDWDMSGNGLTYTFKLRAGSRWVNQAGEVRREVTADDVVFAIQRACDPATLAPHAMVLSIIEGCTPQTSGRVGEVQVRALDPYIVEFVLDHPAAYFPLLMSLPVARPVPAEMMAGAPPLLNDTSQLLTNGPYLIETWQRGERLTLLPNPTYYAFDTLPFTAIQILITEADSALAAYRTGALDTIFLADAESAEPADTADLRAEIEPCTYALGFTLVKPPLDTYRARLALSLAIDRETLIEEFLGGMAIPARTFTPPGVVGGPNDGTEGVSFQPERARDLLAQAGYTAGEGFPPISLMVPQPQQPLGDAIALMWQETLNISVTVTTQPIDQYSTTIDSHTPIQEMPHAWALGWCAEFPDAYAWSHAAFDVQNPPTALSSDMNPDLVERITLRPGNNAARRTPSRFDELTEQAIGEGDAEARQVLYDEAETILLTQEVVVAPIYHYTRPVLAKPWLTRTYFAYVEQPLSLWRIDEEARNLVLTPESE